jgi:hypothetical protein
MGGDREQDAVYAGFILESTHWPCPSSEFSKAALAMAAGVTDHLWEMADLVDMVEAFESRRVAA